MQWSLHMQIVVIQKIINAKLRPIMSVREQPLDSAIRIFLTIKTAMMEERLWAQSLESDFHLARE